MTLFTMCHVQAKCFLLDTRQIAEMLLAKGRARNVSVGATSKYLVLLGAFLHLFYTPVKIYCYFDCRGGEENAT